MEKKWYEVFLPSLPNSFVPSYNEQVNFLEDMNINLWKWDLVFWHSLWTKLALSYVNKNKLRDLKIYLVAPVYPWLAEDSWKDVFTDAYDSISDYFNRDIVFEKLWNEYKVFLSKDDQYIDMNKAKKYLSNLEKVDFIEYENMWHFSKGSWDFTFKDLLEY